MLPANAPDGLILGYFFETTLPLTPHVLVATKNSSSTATYKSMEILTFVPGTYEEVTKKMDAGKLVLLTNKEIHERTEVKALLLGTQQEGQPVEKYIEDLFTDNTHDRHGKRFTYQVSKFVETIQLASGWVKKYWVYRK